MFMLFVIVRNPVVFARAISLNFTLARPDVALSQYITRYTELCIEAAGWFQKAFTPHHIRRMGVIRGWYAAAHDIGRLELYRAGRNYALTGNAGQYAWRKTLGPVTPGERGLDDLANVVGKTTGHIRWAELGISEGRAHAETSLLAPRYLRCVIGLIWSALGGGLRGNESRRTLAHISLAAFACYLLFTVA